MKYISVPLNIESVIEFYDHCASALNKVPNKNDTYDCTKIEVSQERQDIIREYYIEKQAFMYVWMMYGPKVNEELTGEVVKIEEGFIC